MKSIIINCPKDILENLKKEFPNNSNPERIRRIYDNHIEMKMLKQKLTNVGSVIYGKKVWENRFK